MQARLTWCGGARQGVGGDEVGGVRVHSGNLSFMQLSGAARPDMPKALASGAVHACRHAGCLTAADPRGSDVICREAVGPAHG